MRCIYVILALLVVANCTHPRYADRQELQVCETSAFKVDADFSAGGMAACSILNERTVEVFIRPEDVPINKSPWYAVRLTPVQSGNVRLILRYDEHPHRYRPKISTDGLHWTAMPDARVRRRARGFRVSLKVELGDAPVFVAGQELFTNAAYDAWADGLEAKPFVTKRVIGASIEGRPIEMLATQAPQRPAKTLILLGRQHPPEVSGALAMVAFVDEVLGDSELAARFRARFDTAIVPNMNPDGVEHGYWRHNMGGVDLNRDWGPFTQPETQAVKSVIDALEGPGPVLSLDFHSTHNNVFYTQPEGDDGTRYAFTREWLRRSGERLPNYDLRRQGAHSLDRPTSKTYMHARFGIPAITYELGDETDRQVVAESARVFAQEMMTTLLQNE